MRQALRRILWFLFDIAMWLGFISKKRIREAMGFQPPKGIPVPMFYVKSLDTTFCVCAVMSLIQNPQIGVMVKEAGAVDYTCVGGGIVIQMTEADWKTHVEATYGGDERKAMNMEYGPVLQKELNAYLRERGWGGMASDVTLPSDTDIDAMASEIDQMNYKLARYGQIRVSEDADPAKSAILLEF